MLLHPSASYRSFQSSSVTFLSSFSSHDLFHSGPLSHAQTILYVHIQYAYVHTYLLSSLCEPLLRRQVWVERPLGSGSRYCRIERRSILDHYSSTEQWGERIQSMLVRMQAILKSSSVYGLDFGPRLSFSL